MPQRHTPAYPAEFRERLVELVRSGRSLEELRRLRKEVKKLKVEREILKKAAARFAQETDSVPPKNSNS